MRIVRADSRAISALVRGTHQYEVNFTARHGEARIECTCPYALDCGICKHGWAVLQQADSDGTLDAVIATAGAKPIFRSEPGWEPDDDELFDSDAALDDKPASWNVHKRATARRAPRSRLPEVPKPRLPEWKRILGSAQQQMRYIDATQSRAAAAWPNERRLIYIVDLDATWQADGVVVHIGTEKRRKDGAWDAPKNFGLGAATWFAHPDPLDRQIAQMLLGATPNPYGTSRTSNFVVRGRAFDTTMRLICETGRCRVRTHGQFLQDALRCDDGAPWQFRLRVVHDPDSGYALTGVLRRDADEMSLVDPVLLHRDGFLFTGNAIARFDHGGVFPLIAELRGVPALALGAHALPDLLEAVHSLPNAPLVELPPDVAIRASQVEPRPCATLGADPEPWRARGTAVTVSLGFLYEHLRVNADEARTALFDRDAGVVHRRDREREAVARQRLTALGVNEEWDYRVSRKRLIVPQRKLAALVHQLLHEGWHVDADGASYRPAGAPRAEVRSGIDWFDLDASVSYGDMIVPLPDLLEARRRGQETIALHDGSLGLLPLEWLTRMGPVAASGESAHGVTRFRKSQVALLDALLATLPEVTVDATFGRARAELRRFERVEPATAPTTFKGTLREYQREGLGWLHFLRQFGLGGCLADDMGLGKTVQVLALLDSRRLENPGPSIVVVPRSLVFNWMREAERFTPALRVMDYSRTDRSAAAIDPASVDVVLTTYGTLRRDAATLNGIEFEYAILDEAQAIKNAGTASAKAARLLRARHRLALSGTPIENRIEELWSLFEFLNPGMLGAASHFTCLARRVSTTEEGFSLGNGDHDAGRALLARALRPVILRRTKEKVAAELPPRVEQTLEVELEPPQRKFYEALRATYHASVLARVNRDGIKRSRMHILEALLRLRQAACHPVLADRRKAALPSAKLDALLPAIGEVVAEGHKALVFSQFTTFLALARERLEKAGIAYEYLDGKVRDRQSRVDRFQSDPACPVFLISLKAGGQGLNLTAADYVFILDPWWNPAVEAQAIDRTHRIGQTRRVIATRLVARSTIEEKILELQAAKRSLADAILSADAGVLAAIGREELELLLGGGEPPTATILDRDTPR